MNGSAGAYTQDNRIGKLTTDLGKDELLLMGLAATERLSESYSVTVDAVSETPKALHQLLGTRVGVSFDHRTKETISRDFAGVLWEYSELGHDERGYHYQLVLRPEPEFMTLNKRNRIFQKESPVDIVKLLLAGAYRTELSGSYSPLEYCVQYQESDFDFVSRLMEFEGIYYFYEHEGMTNTLVLIDGSNVHPLQTPRDVSVRAESDRQTDAPIWSVTERRSLGPTKVSIADYDFEAPETKLLKTKAAAKPLGEPPKRNGVAEGGASGTWTGKAELYDFPGKYTAKSIATGERYGAIRLDACRRRMQRSFADGNFFAAAVGRRVTLKFENGGEAEYLIIGTQHDYVAPPYDSGEGEETFRCSIELMPAAEQYRPSLATPRPRILGPQTAVVVGAPGEEIYTDKYGRIKVQFFWDREGTNDENSSCFIRVVQSGAGQGWGSFALPRIGQEVVVEFLDGDPDRPLVTGAVYNGKNNVPEELPKNMTQFGLKTRITKGGGGFNRLWFEDKKGKEVVWFKAERDYDVHVLHGNETRLYSDGNRTTTFKTGNDEKIIDKGNLTTTVKLGDETRTIDKGKRTTTVNNDDTLEVKMGNRSATIKMGDDTLKVAMGNVDTKVDLGKHNTEAMQSIELVVGASSIKVDQTGVTIKGMMVKIEGTAMLQQKAPMVQSQADAMQMIKGGIVMIN